MSHKNVENNYLLYLKSYVFRLQEYYDRGKEEFYNESLQHFYSKPIELESKLKLEEEIRRVNQIIHAYEKFRKNE
jgi:hypothetical protein